MEESFDKLKFKTIDLFNSFIKLTEIEIAHNQDKYKFCSQDLPCHDELKCMKLLKAQKLFLDFLRQQKVDIEGM